MIETIIGTYNKNSKKMEIQLKNGVSASISTTWKDILAFKCNLDSTSTTGTILRRSAEYTQFEDIFSLLLAVIVLNTCSGYTVLA